MKEGYDLCKLEQILAKGQLKPCPRKYENYLRSMRLRESSVLTSSQAVHHVM
jgi:hypothetical protein